MISKEFFKQIEAVADSRGIPKEKIYDVFKKGLESAYKKTAPETTSLIRVEFDENKSKIAVYAQWLVVTSFNEDMPEADQILLADAKEKKKTIKVGDILEIEVTPKDFGRIAAITAKQVLMQGLKNIEREQVYEVFSQREHEMVVGIVINKANGFYTLDLGQGATTSLPEKELLPTDSLQVGDKVKVYVSLVEMTTKGPKIYVTRIDPKLVVRLMENIIPELVDGTIEIAGIARDAGDRCKVCIMSNDKNVDELGACLGRGGERIKEVIESLNGEKIDLFRYSKDNKELIANSLQPATVKVVKILNEESREALAVVPDDQLSLAIGKKGQNVRLAVNAIGWKIDIKSESQAKEIGLDF